jgi:ATP-dependent exoDNAse (exonuclease V) beta subunit
MVHEALRRWCFPGDPRLHRLLEISARTNELVSNRDIDLHIEQATILLSRLRSDPRWATLDQAQRSARLSHEVPFTLMKTDKPILGIIDLLYADADGTWHVVDFKTDRIVDEDALRRLLLEEDYRAQMARYRYAVSRLLGGTVISELCFLDFAGTVRWEAVGNG